MKTKNVQGQAITADAYQEFILNTVKEHDGVILVDGGQKVDHFGGQLRASKTVAGRGVRGTIAATDAVFPFPWSAVGERCFQARVACTARRTSPVRKDAAAHLTVCVRMEAQTDHTLIAR